MQKYFLPGLALYALWNLAAFGLVMIDKRRSQRHEWRISERTFFICTLAFGGVGVLLGMRVFRHKTRHWSFTIGIPLLCLVNIACGYFLWKHLFFL